MRSRIAILQFVFRHLRPGASYLSDGQPQIPPYQRLQADGDSATCSSALSFSNDEALFDNVIVK
jgi:hypothetical protein